MIVQTKTRPETYIKHAEQNGLVKFAHKQFRNVTHLPVCPHCERLAMRDVRSPSEVRVEYDVEDVRRMPITCPQCGYHGYTTHSMAMYVKEYI